MKIALKKIVQILCFSFVIAAFPLTTNAQYAESIQELHQQVNQYRDSRGLGELRLLREMCRVAQQHAEDMAAGRIGFSHAGFDNRIQQLKRRYRLSAYSAAENLFFTTIANRIPRQSLQGWIESPGHHKNLKGDFLYTGIGIAKGRKGFYVVQIYLRG